MKLTRRTVIRLLAGAVLPALALAWLALVGEDVDRHRRLLGNTLQLAFHTCLVSLPLGTLAAVLIWRTDVPGRRWAMYLFGMMLFVPLYVQAAAWDAGFARMGWFTLASEALDQPLLDGWRAVVWIHALAAVPWVTLIVAGSLWTIERELDEAALLDAPAWRAFLVTTLPRLLPALAIASLWVCLMTVAEMTVADLYRVPTYAEDVYLLFTMEDDRWTIVRQALPGMLVAGGIALSLVVAAALLSGDRGPGSLRPPFRFPVSRWRVPTMVVLLLLLVLVIGVPLGNLIYKAGFVTERLEAGFHRRWSPIRFVDVLTEGVVKFRSELETTAVLGAVTALAAFAIAAPLAWLARRGGWRGLPALTIALVCASLPGPLIGVFVIVMLDRPESDLLAWLYDRTILAPVLALLVRSLPLSVFLCWLALRSVPEETLESAATEGAGPIRRFVQIGVGQRTATLAAAWLATFAYAIGDLAASVLVTPPDMFTVSVRVFGLIHAGVRHDEAALCLISAAGFTALAATAAWLLNASSVSRWRADE